MREICILIESTKNVGLVGDATTASSATGKEYHDKFLENLVELIRYYDEEVKVTLRDIEIPL